MTLLNSLSRLDSVSGNFRTGLNTCVRRTDGLWSRTLLYEVVDPTIIDFTSKTEGVEPKDSGVVVVFRRDRYPSS